MEIKHYFTTPLVLFENKSLLSDLKKYIYNYQVEGIDSNIAPHLKKNLVESKFNFFCSDNKIIVETTNFIGKSIGELVNELHAEDCLYEIRFVDSWFHIGKTNSEHELHGHCNCSWCGVYFVQAGDAGSGETVFSNPANTNYIDSGNRYLDQNLSVRIQPENGLLILFPSHLRHYQSLYTGKKDRIVVAFNAQVHF